MASTENVNYYLRPGKNVERKLIFECFRVLGQVFDIKSYRYVGLGSVWFVDFVLAHKILRIENMVSIEEDDRTFSRAVFNKPFDCIQVEHGSTTGVLPELGLEELPHLIWLDYDTGIEGPVFEDTEILCSKLPSGSVITLTLNAHNGHIKDLVDGDPPSKEALLEELYNLAGNAIPTSLPDSPFGYKTFPKVIAQIMLNHLVHLARTKSGNALRFVPLFNFFHDDGAPMITIGGVIVNKSDEPNLLNADVWNLPQARGHERIPVTVPPLTLKEKAALDQLLPNPSLTAQEIKNLHGFELKPKHIEAYRSFYRYYPIYGELDF